MRYDHTQTAPLYLLLLAIGSAMLATAVMNDESPVARGILAGAGGLLLVTGASFRQLTLRDEGDQLLVSFGPLPLFRRHVRYSDIQSVERARTTLLDGWGIHYSVRGGWVWNLWGFECVTIHFHNGKKLHLGTDDSHALAAFLSQQATPAE